MTCTHTQKKTHPHFPPHLVTLFDTVPGVAYKFIASKADLLVTPYTSGFLRDNNPLVENVTLQDLCPVDLSGHIALCLDRKSKQFFF